MKLSSIVPTSALESRFFLLLLLVVSVAFVWVLWPFYGAVFWGAIFALMFTPLFVRLLKAMPGRRTLAALATLAIILLLVILPLGLIVASLVQEASAVYQGMQSGKFSLSIYFQEVYSALPAWVIGMLDRFGLSSTGVILERVSASLSKGSQFLATQAINIGQNAFDFIVSFFVMLYLVFFLLRDGSALARRIRDAVPLESGIKRELSGKFVTVIRATVKGNVVVAMLQGALGGVIFWMLGIHAPVLWGTLMAFLSLLPAVGAALVWGPVAIYFLVTGAVAKGLVLTAFGVLVIGLVDNILRPLLVGKDTKIPDYVVLVTTLGGMALFGLNGFVIGPVVAAMFMAVWDLFAKAREEAAQLPAEPQQVLPAKNSNEKGL
ncbi:AI-2E family transporter [Polaromonas sp.]|uniref:AI-2E family transporter n=1 Tax=Polaromonas sp. TaxID=1869339 RepID=UPI00356A4892